MTAFRSLFALLLCISIVSCKESVPEMTAKDILSQSIKAHGQDTLKQATVDMYIDDLHYNIYRQNNVSKYELTRVVDTTTYKAIYENGNASYLINGVPQPETIQSRRFIESRLEGFIFVNSIPMSLDQNHMTKTRLEDVTIKKKSYYQIQVNFKDDFNTAIENTFIIYVDKDTHFVDYVAHNYNLMGAKIIFQKPYNVQTLDGVRFSDYFRLTSEDPKTQVKELYNLFETNALKELKPVNFKKISLKLHE